MNIQKQVKTIRSYGTPSIFNGTNLWFVENGTWKFYGKDGQVHDGPLATGSFEPNNEAQLYSGHNFQRNLELLNERINTIHKELSYWDLYKITTAILTPASLPAVISSLAVGESAVINCETFTYNQKTYHRGDVIVKVSDTKELFIPAENTGIYKPNPHVQSTAEGYIITYEYQPGQPNSNERTIPLDVTLNQDSVTYGNTYTFNINHYSETFATYSFNNTPIKPVIKTFIKINNDYEEIVVDDMSVVYSNGQWTVEVPSTTFNEIINNLYVQVK